jgi:cytochrome c-type biogenesis protein CcmH/NrfF
MRRRGYTAVLALTFALISAIAWPASALADPQDVANQLSTEIMSPYCTGFTLHDCTSSEAAVLRDRIAGWAARGWDKDRIKAKLLAEFGPTIFAAPPRSGIGLWAWLLPLFAVAGGAVLMWRLLGHWTSRPAPTPAGTVSAEDHRRVEAEMQSFRADG